MYKILRKKTSEVQSSPQPAPLVDAVPSSSNTSTNQFGIHFALATITSFIPQLSLLYPPVQTSTVLRDEAFWHWVRDQYALNHTRIYMNTGICKFGFCNLLGGLGPATKAAISTQVSVQAELQAIADPGHQYFAESSKKYTYHFLLTSYKEDHVLHFVEHYQLSCVSLEMPQKELLLLLPV